MTSGSKSLTVTTTQFEDGERMPDSAAHQMVGGQNISPDVHWDGVPEGTQSIAVTMYDPDAPTPVGFVHWVVFNLPPDATELPAGAGTGGKAPQGATMGLTDMGTNEYGGMAPPQGDQPHHYQITVYALDIPKLDSGPTTTYAMFHFQIRGHILAQGTVTGTYSV